MWVLEMTKKKGLGLGWVKGKINKIISDNYLTTEVKNRMWVHEYTFRYLDEWTHSSAWYPLSKYHTNSWHTYK